MNRRSNRRDFLRQTAFAGASFWLAGSAAVQSRSPNEKLNIGIIGAGGRGAHNLASVAGENIVALCDVDEKTSPRLPRNTLEPKSIMTFANCLMRPTTSTL